MVNHVYCSQKSAHGVKKKKANGAGAGARGDRTTQGEHQDPPVVGDTMNKKKKAKSNRERAGTRGDCTIQGDDQDPPIAGDNMTKKKKAKANGAGAGTRGDRTTQGENGNTMRPPPSPWRNSRAKKKLQELLEDPTSRIHTMSIPDIQESDPLFRDYNKKNFKDNFKRLRDQIKSGNGGAGCAKSKKSKHNKRAGTKASAPDFDWKSSKEKVLLRRMLMDEESPIHNMTPKEIFKSHVDFFTKYEWKNFKTNLKNLREKIISDRQLVLLEEAAFKQDIKNFPRNATTNRGYPFWDTHAAMGMLEKDVENGIAYELKPKQLRASKEEYQDFPLLVFGRHVHQEKRKQREEPYWVFKRNATAQKTHDEEVTAMKREWDQEHDEDVKSMTNMFVHCNLA
jgi:hypothetical protein